MNLEWRKIADGRVPRKARGGLFIARTRKAAFYEVSSEPTYVSVGSNASFGPCACISGLPWKADIFRARRHVSRCHQL